MGAAHGSKQIKNNHGARPYNKFYMTKIDKFLRIMLIMLLSAYQMKHIAKVEGWEAAIIIEGAIIIMSILRANVPLALLLLISSGFVLSYHFDGGFVLSIKAVSEILMSFSIPFINAFISRKKDLPEDGTDVATDSETDSGTPVVPQPIMKPVPKKKTSLSQETVDWIISLKRDSNLSLRQIEDKTAVPKSTVDRILKAAV